MRYFLLTSHKSDHTMAFKLLNLGMNDELSSIEWVGSLRDCNHQEKNSQKFGCIDASKYLVVVNSG